MLISTSKFCKGNKITRARRACVICSRWKIYKYPLQQFAREITLLLVSNLHEKKITERQDRRNFESVHALFVICTRVTTWHSCYTRMHLFSANKKHVKFSCTLIGEERLCAVVTILFIIIIIMIRYCSNIYNFYGAYCKPLSVIQSYISRRSLQFKLKNKSLGNCKIIWKTIKSYHE